MAGLNDGVGVDGAGLDKKADADLDDLSPWDLQIGQSGFSKWGAGGLGELDDDRNDGGDCISDDYSDEQTILLKMLKAELRLTYNRKTQWRRRKKALTWCFVRTEKNSKGLSFHLVCTALGARPDVMQARLHRQFYLAGLPMPEPLPLFADLLPDQYESEAIMAAWESGLVVVKEVWRWPGIPVDELAIRVGAAVGSGGEGSDINSVLEKLEDVGLVARRFGMVFLTGRADETVIRRSFSWSRSFP